MKTNLIIVEGLPGSGKSTTAAMIADALNKAGKKVVCVDEGVAHALRCGAKKSEIQYFETSTVMFDPEGHPFCLSTVKQ